MSDLFKAEKEKFIAKHIEKFGFTQEWFDALSDKEMTTLATSNSAALKKRPENVFRKYRAERFPAQETETKADKKALTPEQIKMIASSLKNKGAEMKISFNDKAGTTGTLVETIVKFKVAVDGNEGVTKVLSANKIKELIEK